MTERTYQDAITDQCTQYAQKYPLARFIGYNTIKGSRMYKTLSHVPEDQCIEMPVCENLMMGMAIGLALDGMRPVVCFERHDFLLIGLDALVNHADKMGWMSGEQFNLPIIVRVIVGAQHPLNPGMQHTMDYTKALRHMLKFTEVIEPMSERMMDRAWNEIVGRTISGTVIIVEHRDRYNWTLDDDGMYSQDATKSGE